MRLRKSDVEVLLATFDTDSVVALVGALRRVLDQSGASFDELITLAQFDRARSEALLARDQRALDALAAELNELRGLAR